MAGILAMAMAMAGCGSDATPASSPAAVSTEVTAGTALPSDAAKMICADEAREDIESALGQKVTKPLEPTWTNQLYSCAYVFAQGTMVLSVKELVDERGTRAYFDEVVSSLGQRRLFELGEEGFQANNGSVVIRKDNKVLDVDVTGLPARLGAYSRPDVGSTVAITIMGCWTGD